MAVSSTGAALTVDGAFQHERVTPVDFDAIDTEGWLEEKVHEKDDQADPDDSAEGLENDSADVADSEQDPGDGELDEDQGDPDAGEAEDGQNELPSDEPAEQVVLPDDLADRFENVQQLGSAFTELERTYSETSQALEAQREMTQRLQWQAAKVPVPQAPIRFDSLPPDRQQQLAEIARQQGFENPQQLLFYSWQQDVAEAQRQNAIIETAQKEHNENFDRALKDLGRYVNQDRYKPYAEAIEAEWSSNPALFEALQMMAPDKMLAAAKHLTDLVAKAAAADQRQKAFDAEALRQRQQGREEHRRTRETKVGGSTEASRPNPVTVTKPKPKAEPSTSSSRVRNKLAELEAYDRHDRIG